MPYLAAAVLLVAAIATVNLAATLALTRRLTSLDGRFSQFTGGMAGGVVPVNRPVKEFSARTVDGELVSRDSLTGFTLVGAMSAECPPCHKRLPEFIAGARIIGREHALAIVTSEGRNHEEMVAALAPHARVIVEVGHAPVAEAFGADRFPEYLLIDPDRNAVLSGNAEELGAVPAPAAV